MEPDGHGFLPSKERAAAHQPWLVLLVVLLVLVPGQRAGIEDDDEDEDEEASP